MNEDHRTLVVAIRTRLREGRLPCADAFRIAQEQGVAPEQVAATAEGAGVRIGWCQLGLFGARERGSGHRSALPAEVPAELRAQIELLLEAGQLPCIGAWAVAGRLGLERIEVGKAADALGVRVSRCQLGCFA